MKYPLTLQILLLTIGLIQQTKAQPVISNGANLLPFGYTDSIYQVPYVPSPSLAGAGVVWDFSTSSVGYFLSRGAYTVMKPAATLYNHPGANYAVQKYPNNYLIVCDYYQVDSTGWSIVGLYSNDSSSMPQVGYINTRQIMPFPFVYGQSKVDSFQRQTGNPDRVIISYDGYGTFISPQDTYKNVVRIYNSWSNGATTYYWFTTAPLGLLAELTVNGGSNAMTYYRTSHPGFLAVSSVSGIDNGITVFPNPAKTSATLRVTNFQGQESQYIIRDALGKIVRQEKVLSSRTSIPRGQLPSALYFIEVFNKGLLVGNSRLLFE